MNLEKFQTCADSYNKWISIGIKLYQASCSFETFKNFSKLSSKYNKQACIKKWESFTKIQKNSNMLITLLNKMDIEIRNNSKQTSLMIAVAKLHIPIIDYLIEHSKYIKKLF